MPKITVHGGPSFDPDGPPPPDDRGLPIARPGEQEDRFWNVEVDDGEETRGPRAVPEQGAMEMGVRDPQDVGEEMGAQDPSVQESAPEGESEEGSEELLTYEDFTVAELKEECKARELDTSGKKADLVARLEADDATTEE